MLKRLAPGTRLGLVYLLSWGCGNRAITTPSTDAGGHTAGTTGAPRGATTGAAGAAGATTGAAGATTGAAGATPGAAGATTGAAGTCACDTTIHTTDLLQQHVSVSQDCFCASAFGFLCRDFDQVAALCSRGDVHQVSASSFDSGTLHFLQVTIGSVAKGRPTHATLKFDGNSFAGASYEADLLCNNLPADEVNDTFLYVYTDGYEMLDPTCGSSNEWNPCASDAGADAPVFPWALSRPAERTPAPRAHRRQKAPRT